MGGRGSAIGSNSISTSQAYNPCVFFFRSTVGSRSFGGNGLSLTEDVSGKVGDDILLLNGLGKASIHT